MAATIQQIADLAGVSRGTVDRALNNRGRINPEVAGRIQEIADELGYIPKHRKKQAAAGSGKKIGIVTQLSGSSFMIEVNRGIREAKKILEDRGMHILVKEGTTVDEKEQLEAIRELVEAGIDGLALMPVDSPKVREKINELAEEKRIPVVTFNSDLPGTGRSCYVGMDNRRSGQTAAGLMGLMTRGIGKILVITGYFSNSGNSQRVDGFIETLKQDFPRMELTGVQTSFDKTEEVEKIIASTMQAFPDLAGILVVSGGQAGVWRALSGRKTETRPYVILYDLTPKNQKALQEGSVDFLIDQEGYEQGYRPPFLLADHLLQGEKAEREYMYTEISIRNKYNVG